jgi:serine/threonine-protein kinase
MDWGVARSSRAPDVTTVGGSLGESQPELPGTLIGTPCYMAPEQLVGLHDQVDHRTDVFGLGAMLYEILTGQPPRNTKNVVSTLRGVLTEIVPPENVVEGAVVPAELSRISLKAMAHKPLDRYQSVDELKGDIERFLRGAWHLPKKYFDKGTVIVREGEMGGEAYIILEGRCAAVRNDEDGEVLLREMGPGEVFGEMAVLSNKARSASVKALTDVVLMVVSSEILSNALGLNFWMGSFVRTLVDRFREVDERLRSLEQNQRSRGVPPSR